MINVKDIKEIEKKLYELSASFVLLLDNLKEKGIITQEEYEAHTKVKKDFMNKLKCMQ